MHDLLDNIIQKRLPCFFVSPHLDDAAFSAAGLISYLNAAVVPVTIVNVFTAVGDHQGSLSARAFLAQCGYSSPEQLFSDRIKEDQLAFAELANVKIINLGCIDSLWRLKSEKNPLVSKLGHYIPELVNVYPTHRWHVNQGKIAKADAPLIKEISQKIKAILPPKSVLFAPLAVGNHVDHVVVKQVCSSLRSDCIYWLDYPYHLKNAVDQDFIMAKKLKRYDFNQSLDTKQKIILKYSSQLKPIFGTINPEIIPDYYFVPDTQIS